MDTVEFNYHIHSCLTVPLVRVCFTFKIIETRACSALRLADSNKPTSQTAERALVSITLNVKKVILSVQFAAERQSQCMV
ncbi:hypothetical protein SFRURICE_017926 [Spodoptera frugiperda]|nr:hypothetical protein SFRURICE_017926 [Spodoptera frugiperda]